MNLFLVAIILIIAIKYILQIKKRRDVANKIQGPPSLPVIGHYDLYTLSSDQHLSYLVKIQKQFKDYFKLWVGLELWLIVHEPKLIEKVLTDPSLIKSHDYNSLKPWLGNGLLINEGQKWFARRKAITPAFHFNILEDFLDIFAHHADVLVDQIKVDEPVNVTPLLLNCAFDVICETSMGTQMNAQTSNNSPYVKAVESVTEILYKKMFNPILGNSFVFKFSKYNKILEDNLGVIAKTTQQVISARRKYFSENPDDSRATNEFGQKKKMPLIDTLLKTTVDGEPLTDQDVQDEVNTFLFAGHDTTSHTVSFFLYNVAKHPEVQKKVYDEIVGVYGTKPENSELSTRKMNELKYLEMVTKESMRLYSAVPFIGRQIVEERSYGDLRIPANTNLSIFLYGMFRSPEIFDNPDAFDPERFSPDSNNKEFSPFAFLPFSAGPRNCIGQKFAQLEMKTIIVKILTNYELKLAKPNEELQLLAGMILKSKNGINLIFKKR